jgi:hypothetical protein
MCRPESAARARSAPECRARRGDQSTAFNLQVDLTVFVRCGADIPERGHTRYDI